MSNVLSLPDRPARIALFAAFALLASCATAPRHPADGYDLNLVASARVNPDGAGRASPILVGIYALKSTTTFDTSDFGSLQDRAKATLGDDLVSFEQLILLPGEHKLIRRNDGPSVHALGVVAGYREQDRRAWRATYTFPDRGESALFSLWPFTPERLALRVNLGAGGLMVSPLDGTQQ
ncbi:type VI secretion system lipoprotein TssJ [Paraburkholderia sp.]|uniref:type VI secretion system lipoprotein TssJ n=1 Tax=Paraburkholderia sp. TaxID=1926495 RepID=UPI0023884AD2|nr:type VI secretion system lipoprotein TssJ [Paraburkholderia sp.]MDE1183224.1 type VI secretion system lipoprotein TssJ [Paraburkholderia sp.]